MTLPFFFEALRRRIALILIVVMIATAAGLMVGATWPKTYTSSAQILLGLEVDDDIDAQSGNLYLKERVATYAQTVKADEIVEPVATAASISPDVLRRHISVSIVPETVVLEISVSADTPEQAVQLTNAVSRRFQSQVSALNVETGGPRLVAAQFSSPQPAVEPDQLHGALLVGVSILVGLILGILLALMLAAMEALRRASQVDAGDSRPDGTVIDAPSRDDATWWAHDESPAAQPTAVDTTPQDTADGSTVAREAGVDPTSPRDATRDSNPAAARS